MLRQPAVRRNQPGLKNTQTKSIPAPVGGWNTRDPLAAMPPNDAVVLENMFPTAATVELRKGAQNWVTGFTLPPASLFSWNGPTSSKMFAATPSGIFDVTTSGVLGASVNAVTNGLLYTTNFTIIGGSYLIAVNGVDKLRLYDGTTWAAIDGVSVPAITGLPTTSLTFVEVIKRKLWFAQKDSLSAWYLPTASIGGALTEFPLGQVFGRGGHLVAFTNWTIDGGDGSDDYTVFVSSEGEVAVYKGSDPASAATFAHVGTYYIGEPIGRNCLCKYGGDVLLLCQNGLFPLSKALQSSVVDRSKALTAKIDPSFTEAASLYSSNPGWQCIAYPQGNLLIVNIPISAGLSHQYVMNTITGAWCKFTGWDAVAFEVCNKQLYFANSDRIAKAWSGAGDFGTNVVGKAQQAFNYFGARGQGKHFKLLRPIIAVDGTTTLLLSLATDYDTPNFFSASISATATTSIWDTALWDAASWAEDTETRKAWSTIFSNECYAAGLRLQVSSPSITLSWSVTDFVYELGGVL